MSDVIEATKTCTKCRRVLNLSEFHRDRNRPDGLHVWCRECSIENTKQNAARRRAEMGEEAYLAEQRERTRRSRARNPEPNRRQNRAQARALAALRENHRAEYERLLEIEKRRAAS